MENCFIVDPFFYCIKDVIFVTENPDAGCIFTLSHLLLL